MALGIAVDLLYFSGSVMDLACVEARKQTLVADLLLKCSVYGLRTDHRSSRNLIGAHLSTRNSVAHSYKKLLSLALVDAVLGMTHQTSLEAGVSTQ